MSASGEVLLWGLTALVAGSVGTWCLGALLVMGGRTGVWLESHGWVYPAAVAAGGTGIAVGLAVALLPLAALGTALVVVGAGRYLWLNV